MRIAVAADGEMVGRFSDAKWFRLYEAEEGRVTRVLTVPALGEDWEALVQSLADYRANVLICGPVSGKARVKLGEAGILSFGGVIGNADRAVSAMLAGSLADPSDGEGCAHTCNKDSCQNCKGQKMI